MQRTLCSLLLLTTCLVMPSRADDDAGTIDYMQWLATWQEILTDYVDDEGRVAFEALADDRAALDGLVATIAVLSPATAPAQFDTPEAVLAYHINTYNALAMHGVIDEGIPDAFNGFFKRAGFFKFRKVRIGGDTTSLYDYENKVIRPLDEPRIHFALNCMVRDCPRLPREPFVADRLDAQLEAVTREFFAKSKHLRVDHDAQEIEVSEILDFYTKDFVASGKRQDLIGYINRYVDEPIPETYRVRFIPYDWTINRQA